MTPEQRAALERYRRSRTEDIHDVYGGRPVNTPSGGTIVHPDACEGMMKDERALVVIALDDYPVDDTCKMSRQELIAEVTLLKRHRETAKELCERLGLEIAEHDFLELQPDMAVGAVGDTCKLTRQELIAEVERLKSIDLKRFQVGCGYPG